MDDFQNFFLQSFKKIKLIKKNSKSEVWLAVNAEGSPVIFKIINLLGLPYQNLKKIQNPLCAKIFFAAEIDNQTFVVEEFIPGENLSEKNLKNSQAKKFLLQLCDGLKILHDNGIIHRDIKPANLIVQNENFIRLIDFDAARIFKPNKIKDTILLGTENYAPPEQFGFGQTDPRSDIFSLGKTFQEILGKNCSRELKKILKKCTELDPAKRFQSVEELKFALLEKNSNQIEIISIILAAGILIYPTEAQEKILKPEIKIERVEKIPQPVEEKKSSPFSAEDLKISPQVEIPQKIPEISTEISPQIPEKFSDSIEVKYFWNGRQINSQKNFDYDVKISYEVELKSFEKFSACEVEILVENFTSQEFKNPQVEIIYNDGLNLQKKILRGENILSGGEKTFTIPLSQFNLTAAEKQSLQLKITGEGASILGSACVFNFDFHPK